MTGTCGRLPDSIVTAWYKRNGGFCWRPAGSLFDLGSKLTCGVSVVVCTKDRPESVRRFLGSLQAQERVPNELVVVDASEGDETDGVVRAFAVTSGFDVTYVRVSAPLRGLTKQRNLGARMVRYDLLAFFDDDVVLEPSCLAAMEEAHRLHNSLVVGVGARIAGTGQVPRIWRTRLWLGIVPDLKPGRYHRSGMSTPWVFPEVPQKLLDVDYLPGGASMWKTEIVRVLRFDERFVGYGQGEDLDFSLRAKMHGNLVAATQAQLVHYHDQGGRPDPFLQGHMELLNRWRIHRKAFYPRRLRDTLWFWYAWGVDTLLLLRGLLLIDRCVPTILRVAGRLKAAAEILIGVREWRA